MSSTTQYATQTVHVPVELVVTNMGVRAAHKLAIGELVVIGNSVATVVDVDFPEVPGTSGRDFSVCDVTLQVTLGGRQLVDQVQTVDRDYEYHVFGVLVAPRQGEV
jgi:hypothetical protein